MMEENLSPLMLSLYWGGVTRLEFSTPYWCKDGRPHYLFGGTICVRHCKEMPDLWRVYWVSPFPEKGLLPLKGEDGWLMSQIKAIQLARLHQP